MIDQGYWKFVFSKVASVKAEVAEKTVEKPKDRSNSEEIEGKR